MALKTHAIAVEYLFSPIALPVRHAIFAALSRTCFSITMEIPAPRPLVWSVMSDVERWPEWTASISRVILLSPGPLQVGHSVRVHQPKLPAAVWRVTEFTPGTSFTWISAAPGVRVTARHTVDAMENGSRVNLSIHYEGLLGVLLAQGTRDLNERYLAMEANGLKARCTQLAAKSHLKCDEVH